MIEKLKARWGSAGAVQRALLIAGAIGVIAASAFAIAREPEVEMGYLFTHLSPDDAAGVLETLKEKRVTYRLAEGGTAVMVPRSDLYDLRLELASAGLPRGGGVGFEIFDKDSLLMTDFTQRVNYTRALQGELARTIAELPQVQGARVHLALPKDSIFKRDRKDPSASVYVKLHAGRALSERQIAGITHLISTAVEGLSVDHIALLDGDGRLLSAPPDDGAGGLSARALSYKNEYEARAEERLLAVLEPLVGRGRVVTTITAEVDLSRVSETRELYDPDGATVLRERKAEEEASKSSASTDPRLAGTPGNLPQQVESPDSGSSSGSRSNRETTTVDYAVPKTVRETERAAGSITRLSVAVVIDPLGPTGGTTGSSAAVGGGVEKLGTIAEPNLEELGELVKRAVGFDDKRGDQLQIVLRPFAQPDPALAAITPPPEEKAEAEGLLAVPIWALAAGGLGVLLGFAVFFVMSRRRRARAEEAVRVLAAAEGALLPEGVAAPEGGVFAGQKPDLSKMNLLQRSLHDEVQRAAKEQIAMTAALVKSWLSTSRLGLRG